MPYRVVGVLYFQLRQGISFPAQERSVEGLQFVDHYAHRPAIRNNVVHGDQQHIFFFGQPNQPPANQRACFQVKGRSRFQVADSGQFRFHSAVAAQVMFNQAEAAAFDGAYCLHRFSVEDGKTGSENFMTNQYPVQRLTKSYAVEIALQMQAKRDVICRAAPFHLRQEP